MKTHKIWDAGFPTSLCEVNFVFRKDLESFREAIYGLSVDLTKTFYILEPATYSAPELFVDYALILEAGLDCRLNQYSKSLLSDLLCYIEDYPLSCSGLPNKDFLDLLSWCSSLGLNRMRLFASTLGHFHEKLLLPFFSGRLIYGRSLKERLSTGTISLNDFILERNRFENQLLTLSPQFDFIKNQLCACIELLRCNTSLITSRSPDLQMKGLSDYFATAAYWHVYNNELDTALLFLHRSVDCFLCSICLGKGLVQRRNGKTYVSGSSDFAYLKDLWNSLTSVGVLVPTPAMQNFIEDINLFRNTAALTHSTHSISSQHMQQLISGFENFVTAIDPSKNPFLFRKNLLSCSKFHSTDACSLESLLSSGACKIDIDLL